MFRRFLPLVVIALLVLTACSSVASPPDIAPPPSYKTFTSTRYGIRLDYPADLELRHSFQRSYLAAGGWKTYLGPDAPPGRALVALVMPGSNHITDGELRIGVSRDPAALATCTNLPAAGRPDMRKQVMISGVAFTVFKAADAGMNHYLIVRSFRAVHRGACYAMDVLVFGTNPQVYSPPQKPPFTKRAVFQRLLPVARHLRFINTAAPIAPPATYTGLLPCADCPGIDYQLNLRADHRYRLRLTYRDRDTVFDTRGRWQLTGGGKRLVLREAKAKATPRQWAVTDDGRRLRMLDRSGQPIQSPLHYELTRAAAFAPLAGKRD
jgi:uncharacterized lipoprotein NlpE involved in copper resistance